jgi:PQQ-dependent catabolism-associated beta-propeller protein
LFAFCRDPTVAALRRPVGLPHRFDRAYAGSNRHNSQAERKPVLIDRRALSLAVLPAGFAAVLAALLAVAPAAAKDTGLIFVSNEKSNNLIVIDPKTHKVIRDIKTSRRPRDMHFSVDRTKLYVACGDDDVIDIIDVAKLEVIGRIPTGPSPETFSIDESKRRIYVANEEGSSLSIIDMDQAITIHEVPTGAEPEGVYVSEDGKLLYVTSEVGDIIHMVDAEGGHVLQDVIVGTRPRRFAATPDRKELWVTAELSGEVYIIDREKFEVSGKIEFLPPGMRKSDVTPVGLVMTKDGKTAFVTLGHAAHVAVVDIPTRKVTSYILVGKRSWGITLSRDERTMYVANGFGDDVTVIDVRSRKATVSIPVGRIPWGVIIDD